MAIACFADAVSQKEDALGRFEGESGTGPERSQSKKRKQQRNKTRRRSTDQTINRPVFLPSGFRAVIDLSPKPVTPDPESLNLKH